MGVLTQEMLSWMAKDVSNLKDAIIESPNISPHEFTEIYKIMQEIKIILDFAGEKLP